MGYHMGLYRHTIKLLEDCAFIATHMGIPGYRNTHQQTIVVGWDWFFPHGPLDLVMVGFLPCNHRQQLRMWVNRQRPVDGQRVLYSLQAPG